MQNSFIKHLLNTLCSNWNNNFANNFDFYRFGFPEREIVDGAHTLSEISRHLTELERFYGLLKDEFSRFIFTQVLCFKILGHKKVKLPLSVPEYWNAIKRLEEMADKDNVIEAVFPGAEKIKLYYFDLKIIGIPVKIFNTPKGILSQFLIKQYEYRIDDSHVIGVKPGDIVIDGGACWGDTSLYFAIQAGELGRVYAFEFIPSHLNILRKNLGLNPEIECKVNVIPAPLWESSNIDMYYKDSGPGSSVRLQPFAGMEDKVSSTSIDHFVEENKLEKVDFIKMDIEGSEQKALKGAINTLKRFKPQLAISIYHNFADDFASIANMLHDLNLGYMFFLGHFSTHHEETVLY